MINVIFAEPDSDDWQRWKRRAEKARDAAIAEAKAGGDPKINERLYKEMKQVFLKAFSGKCAYCEAKISADQPGDVEHFRPKAGVTDENDQPVLVRRPDGTDAPHPGYYWLAYDPSNLIPSCNKCNRPWKGPDEVLVGKWNRFPVKRDEHGRETFRATEPGREKDEQPLFINPADTRSNPDLHLKVDGTGILGASTDEGQACIRLLGLNRDGLVDERRRTYLQVQSTVMTVTNGAMTGGDVRQHMTLLAEYQAGQQPYALAGRTALKERRSVLQALLSLLGGG